MTLTNDDIKKVKGAIKSEVGTRLDHKLGPKLEKVEKIITKSLDQRLGPKLENVEILVENVLDRKLDEKLDEKLKNLPTKKEFFGRMDKLLGEVQTSRSEQTILSHRVSTHEDRLQVVENKLNITSAL